MPFEVERKRNEERAVPPASYEWLRQMEGGTVHYVYLLRSESNPSKTYIGYTKDLKARLAAHNAGQSIHTARFRPWKIEAYLGFAEEASARAFEVYLKTSSGKAFAAKRLWARSA